MLMSSLAIQKGSYESIYPMQLYPINMLDYETCGEQ